MEKMNIDLSEVVFVQTTKEFIGKRNIKPYIDFAGKLSHEGTQDVKEIYGEDKLYWLIGKVLYNQANLIQKHGGDVFLVPKSENGDHSEYEKLVGNLYKQLDNIEITFKAFEKNK